MVTLRKNECLKLVTMNVSDKHVVFGERFMNQYFLKGKVKQDDKIFLPLLIKLLFINNNYIIEFITSHR